MQAYLQIITGTLKRMTVREKMLSMLFIIVMLAIWTGSWMGRLSTWNDSRITTATNLTEQDLWLERADAYADSAQSAMERLDSSKTFGAAQLSGRIDNLLRQAGLSTKADIDPVKSTQGEIFNEHTVRVQLKRITIGQMVQFNRLLRKESPYINQLNVRINANRRDREQLDVCFQIASLELITDSI